MIRFFYNLLWPIGLLFFLPNYLGKMFRRGGYRDGFGARLGFYPRDFARQNCACPPTWIHAVSVGETAIALKLAGALRVSRPDLRCVLTVTTTTAHAMALRAAESWLQVIYSPLDFYPIMRRAFRAIRPRRIILIEAEVWPNMVSEASLRSIPIMLANARLSRRSESRFRRARFFVAPFFQKLSAVCVPAAADVPRWQALGVAASRIFQTGSIKFDTASAPATISPEIRETFERVASSRPVLLGGSTHFGEEEILAAAFVTLRKRFPDLFLIVAPRHIERSAQVEESLRKQKVSFARRSATDAGACDCLLLDTTGELANWYAVATVVFIGKSITARGGQNPVEAIVAGKPVLFGPHMENFDALAQALLASQGATEVTDEQSLAEEAGRLLANPIARAESVRRAGEVIALHQGATARTAEIIEKL
ncbi:MAG: 3-deoxy-D-manno-octulosonic acid transferase [Verrucomicrobiota bacterium]|nr:3-deoxy-D-manno-octulosonic acid transferase [Verrucomicrobiota bacterium]